MQATSYQYSVLSVDIQYISCSTNLEQLWVVSAQLLEQSREEGWVLLDDLSHLLELWLIP